MSGNVSSVLKEHHAFYDVRPYFVLLEMRSPAGQPATRKIHAGFDVDIYGTKSGRDLRPSAEYSLVCSALQEVAGRVALHATQSCVLEVVSFGTSVMIDTKRHLERDAMVRIRITHGRGLSQPAGAAEETALREVESELERLGVSNGRQGG